MILITLIVGIIVCLFLFWVFCFLYQHDFSIPLFDSKKFHKVLAIFPHPDDEVATIGGTLQYLSSKGAKVCLVTMTHGEAGESWIPLSEPIGTVRARELDHCAQILGLSSLVLNDFGDGKLASKRQELTTCVHKLITDVSPDLVITFDTAGLYGHPDHITLSEVVTDVVTTSFPHITLWYTTETARVYQRAKLPTFMAKDKAFAARRSAPTYRLWTGLHVFGMTRALYAHRCQLGGFKKSLPIHILPIWFFTSLRLYEYVHEVARNKS